MTTETSHETSLEALAKLKQVVRRDGTVTAANASWHLAWMVAQA
jgi:acetyl-CoA acetyltransferase